MWGEVGKGVEVSHRRNGVNGMTGEYQHSLDAKGRLFIPVRLREELGPEFYVTLSMDHCLNAYSAEQWQIFSDKVNAMPYVKQRAMRPLFSNACKCELDAQGRVLLPQGLRDRGGLKKNVTVLGSNNHAEFWDSDEWAAIRDDEASPENIAAVMQELDF